MDYDRLLVYLSRVSLGLFVALLLLQKPLEGLLSTETERLFLGLLIALFGAVTIISNAFAELTTSSIVRSIALLFLYIAWEEISRGGDLLNELLSRLFFLTLVLFLGRVSWRANLFWVASAAVLHLWFYLWERLPLLSLAVAALYLTALVALLAWRLRRFAPKPPA